MLHVDENNNDELFRRAAADYPLNTDSAEWKSVQDKINGITVVPGIKIVNRNTYWPLLILLLLFVPLKIYENKFNEQGGNKRSGSINESRKNISAKDEISANKTAASAEVNDAPLSSATPSQIIDQSTLINFPKDIVERFLRTDKKIKNNTPHADNEKAIRNSIASNQRTKASVKNFLPESAGEYVQPQNAQKDIAAINPLPQTNELTVSLQNKLNAPVDAIPDSTNHKKKTLKETSSATNDSTGKAIVKKDNKRIKHFYIGLFAGPDFSTIKLQSVKKTGINYGFIAGYQINKKLSIETGLFKDKKKYSSDGKYFDPKEVYLPGYATIEYVDGECNMLEMPVNIYYTFMHRSRSGLFASAGVSSYFMQNESYVYDINHNNIRYPRSAAYDTKSTSLAAVINFSAGFTYKFGNVCNLRLEPYIKLPVKKIGTGNLPIQSAGIMVGIIKNIF